MKRTILDEFITWYINKREGHGANYLKNCFGNDKAMFRSALTEYQEVFKDTFHYDLFVIDSESPCFREDIEKRVSDLYDETGFFAQYSARKANHMPRAILGEKSLIAFLEEIRTTQNLEESHIPVNDRVTRVNYFQKREFKLWLIENNMTSNSSDNYISYLNQLFGALKYRGEINWSKWVNEGASEIIQNQINNLLCLLNDEQTENTLGFELKKLKNIKSALHAYANYLVALSAENKDKSKDSLNTEIGSGENLKEIEAFIES